MIFLLTQTYTKIHH